MAKVIMFMYDELTSGGKERNENFRKKVHELSNLMLEEGYSHSEYHVNTQYGFDRAFEENPDCQLVFTTENNFDAQYQACKRNIPVLEWRCFSDNKVSLIKVDKDMSYGITSYHRIK